ncbi:MAG: lipid-A-disaccharide synthase N-terminal domain-containing protein [Woeseia sp.]
MNPKIFWLAIGFMGQACFFSRFLVQWLASERARRSVIPMAFWYLSLCGGVILFMYAVHLRDPVFIVGQSTGAFIYLRNVWLRLHEHAQAA